MGRNTYIIPAILYVGSTYSHSLCEEQDCRSRRELVLYYCCALSPSQDISPVDREFRLQLVSLDMWMVRVALIVYFDCSQKQE